MSVVAFRVRARRGPCRIGRCGGNAHAGVGPCVQARRGMGQHQDSTGHCIDGGRVTVADPSKAFVRATQLSPSCAHLRQKLRSAAVSAPRQTTRSNAARRSAAGCVGACATRLRRRHLCANGRKSSNVTEVACAKTAPKAMCGRACTHPWPTRAVRCPCSVARLAATCAVAQREDSRVRVLGSALWW